MDTIDPPVEQAGFHVDLNQQAGWLRVGSPVVFNPDRRGFGRHVVDKAAMIPGVRSASIELSSSACRLYFDPDCDLSRMLRDFASALRTARIQKSIDSRPESQWDVLTAFRGNPSFTFWEARLLRPFRLDLRWSPNSTTRLNLLLVAEQLSEITGVQSCRIGFWPRRLLIEFDFSQISAFELLHESHRRWIDASFVIGQSDTKSTMIGLSDVPGLRSISYLALAGGCFLLTLAGLVLPGIPTVPFLVATSFFLERSSPRLHACLLRSPVLGTILREWERYRGLSPESKDKLLKMSLAILLLSAALDPLDPVAITLTMLFGVFACYGLSRIPTVPLLPDGVGYSRKSAVESNNFRTIENNQTPKFAPEVKATGFDVDPLDRS